MAVVGICPTGKKGYLDELDALLTLEELGRVRDSREKTERAHYLCDNGCGMWHLTSQEIG